MKQSLLLLIIIFSLVACTPTETAEPVAVNSTREVKETTTPSPSPLPSATPIRPTKVTTAVPATATFPPATPTPTSTWDVTPTWSPTPTSFYVTKTPTPTPTTDMTAIAATETAVALFTPTPLPISPPPGLIYRTYDDPKGVWQIGLDGQARLLTDKPNAVLSQSGQQALYYEEEGDYWMIDFTTGEERSLTAHLNDIPGLQVQWWQGRTDVVLTRFLTPNGGHGIGLLSTSTNGEHTPLVETHSWGRPDVSPDGQTLAYDREGNVELYNLQGQIISLNLTDFGLSADINVYDPAWSPDGQQIAWAALIPFTNGGDRAIVILNLQNSTGVVVHPFDPVDEGGLPGGPQWSPDGRYLFFFDSTYPYSEDRYGLWRVTPDGGQETYLGFWHWPAWSPDGRLLIARKIDMEPGQESLYYLIDPTTWSSAPINLPPNSVVVGWREVQ